MSMNMSRYSPSHQGFEAQQESQTVIAMPAQVAETTEDDVPPNGGWVAWSQVIGGFLVIFNAQYVIFAGSLPTFDSIFVQKCY